MAAVKTGQRTTQSIAQSQKKSRPATQKAAPKKSQAKKSAPKAQGSISVEIANNPFAPGEKVQVHNPLDVDVQRREGREPQVAPVAKGTSAKDGTLSIKGLAEGAYLAYGEDSQTWLGFTARK